MLRKSGMVHKHVNDKVLGGGKLPKYIADAQSDDDGGFGGSGGGGGGGGAGGAVKGEALPWARPSVKAEQGGVKPERHVGDAEPPGVKRAKREGEGARIVLHGSDGEARQLLHGRGTFDEVMHELRTDPAFAAAVLRCVTSSSKGADKLVSRINALPRLDP